MCSTACNVINHRKDFGNYIAYLFSKDKFLLKCNNFDLNYRVLDASRIPGGQLRNTNYSV